VEQVIRQVEGVADVRVSAQSSSLVGQLVACQVVLARGHGRETVEPAVHARCRQALPSYQRPRIVSFVDQLQLTEAGKTSRG
jgi:acyl-coenzyme A synthetase/AMP-(fatty) acid ligase